MVAVFLLTDVIIIICYTLKGRHQWSLSSMLNQVLFIYQLVSFQPFLTVLFTNKLELRLGFDGMSTFCWLFSARAILAEEK